MKRHTLFHRVLISTLPIFLLPFIICSVFYLLSHRYAKDVITQQINNLHENILSALDELNTNVGQNDTELMFLENVTTIVLSDNSAASSLILSPELQILLPQGEEKRNEQTLLANDFAAAIQNGSLFKPHVFHSSDGNSYLVRISEANIGFIITYCPTSLAGSHVNTASVVVLILSFLGVSIALFLIRSSSISVSKMLHDLCNEAEQIGRDDFSPIQATFPVLEIEDLRLSINNMSAKLQQLEEKKSNFLDWIAHDLRAPLMSVCGYAQGIQCGVFKSPEEGAERILADGKHMMEILERIIFLTESENDPSYDKTASFSVSDAVADCLFRWELAAKSQGVSLRLSQEEFPIFAQGNAAQFSAVIDNLISNAVQYAKSVIEVGVHVKDGRVLITVSDDGTGIAEQDIGHIFDRFFKAPTGHLGLGLSVAKQAAEFMGGSLTVANQPEGGAVFTFSLPQSC